MNFSGKIKLKWSGWLIIIVCLFFIYLRIYKNDETDSGKAPISMKLLLIGAIEAAKLGGTKVVEGANGVLNIQSKGKTLEGANDPVTNADYASHCAMYHTLLNTFSTVHIKSEEHSNGKCPEAPTLGLKLQDAEESIASVIDELVSPEDVTIWIDPLDATKEFTDNLHEYVTTMVCVAVKGVPIIGVVHKPFTQSTSWAWVDKKTSVDLQPIKNTEESKTDPRVIVSMSHKGSVDKFCKDAFGDKVQVISAAGAGFKVLEVAQDRADIYVHVTHIKKWDICAGNAIINSLGGIMTTLDNATIDYTYNTEEVNTKGLLASIKNQYYYVEKVKSAKLS